MAQSRFGRFCRGIYFRALGAQPAEALAQHKDSGKPGKGSVMPPAHQPYHRIVVGIDGSSSSAATLDWAARQAALTQSSLDVLITWEWPLVGLGGMSPLPADYDPARDAAKLLRDLLRVVQLDHPDIAIHPAVCEGRAAPALLEASKTADLLVVGTHGHGELSAALFGSVSEDCAHHATCPVAIVHSEA